MKTVPQGTQEQSRAEDEVLLTIPQVAQTLNVAPKTIRKWEYAKKIKAVRLSNLVRIPKSEVQRLINEGMN